MAAKTPAPSAAQQAAAEMLLPGGRRGKRNEEGSRVDHSFAFTLDGTETVIARKQLVDDALDGTPASMPRLVRFRSSGNPYMGVILSGFTQSEEVARYEVPGGSVSTGPGEVEIVAYGKITTSAYAINSRAVSKASVEILSGLGHVPARPPLSDKMDLVPNDGEAAGDWTGIGTQTAQGWAPGGLTRLDLFTTDEIEFGWFDNVTPTANLIARFRVNGVLLDLRHSGALKLKARHPGGAALTDTRTCVAVWSRES